MHHHGVQRMHRGTNHCANIPVTCTDDAHSRSKQRTEQHAHFTSVWRSHFLAHFNAYVCVWLLGPRA